MAGFPASLIGQRSSDVELKVEDGSLRIRSARTASRYLGKSADALAGADGFVDTRDMVELRGDRYYFVGRRDGIINVGGLKVHPEEVEAVINRHPSVQMSLVRARKSPITGALVVADVVVKSGSPASASADGQQLKSDILDNLPPRAGAVQGSDDAALRAVARGRAVGQAGASLMQKNVIVTGGSRGLGLGIARKLAAAGYRVIAIARGESEQLTCAMREAKSGEQSSRIGYS